jgi:hypothetical protein
MINTDGIQVGQSATDTNNFLITTDGAGGLQIKRKSDGSGGNVLTVSAAGVISQSTPQSLIRLRVAAKASTNTACLTFSTVDVTQGADITYTASATLGDTFTIANSGVYSMGGTCAFGSSNSLAITLNSAQLTTDVASLTPTVVLNNSSAWGSGQNTAVSFTGYLAAGSVIRLQTEVTATVSAARQNLFTIARVA